MIAILMLILLAFILLYSWIILLRDSKNFNVPGPRPLPLVGNGHLFITSPSEFLPLLHKFQLEYGDAFRVHFFHNPYVVLSHPKYAEAIVSHTELITKGRSYYFLRPWLGDGLLTSTDIRNPNNSYLVLTFIMRTYLMRPHLPPPLRRIFKVEREVWRGTECEWQHRPRTHEKRMDFSTWIPDISGKTIGFRWRTTRKFLTPAFHFNILQNFLPVFLKNEKILIKKLQNYADGKSLDLFPIIALTALDNVTESIMGVSIEAQTNSESQYVKSIDTISKIVSKRMQNPFIGEDAIFNLLQYKKAQDKALNVLHSQTLKVIEIRREELKNANVTDLKEYSDTGIKNKHAFLDLLLLSKVDGKNIGDEHVREEVDTFMFEGHDTTTSGISFTLYCLAKHPEIQEKILEEQRNILGKELERDPSYAELKEMRYLELVIKESLRLYPSVPLIERLMTKDTEIAGLKLRKNTSVIVNIFEIHRHPELYENPMEFRPERHNTLEPNSTKNAFSWLAFSAGPRNCIGQKFAMMELKVTVASIIKSFIVLPADMKEPGLCSELILKSDSGVNVKLKPRKKIY